MNSIFFIINYLKDNVSKFIQTLAQPVEEGSTCASFPIIKARWLFAFMLVAFITSGITVGSIWPEFLDAEKESLIPASVIGILLYFVTGTLLYISSLRNRAGNYMSLTFGVLGIVLQTVGRSSHEPLGNIIGTALLVIGLAYYAKGKERNLAWGLMGVLGIIGIIVLVFLKDHQKKSPPEELPPEERFAIGLFPPKQDAVSYSLLGIPMVCLGFSSLMILFLPLSYLSPEFVEKWLLDTPKLILLRPDTEAVVSSLLNIVSLVVLAPVVEEFLFRGFLLNRWLKKYGVTKAVILSSAIFCLMHADILGAFVFGVVLSLVYLRTQSIFGPIIVHISNNAIVTVIVIIYEIATGGLEAETSLDEFQDSWWIAPIGAVICIPWLVWFLKRRFSRLGQRVG